LQQDEEEEKHRKCTAKAKKFAPDDFVVAVFDDLISAHSSKRSRTQSMFDTAALKGALMEDAMAWEELCGHDSNKGHNIFSVTDKTKEAVHDISDNWI